MENFFTSIDWKSPFIRRLLPVLIPAFLSGIFLTAGNVSGLLLGLLMLALTAYQLNQLARDWAKRETAPPPVYKPRTDNHSNTKDEALFFKNIVQHVGIGLMALQQNGDILFINSFARRLFKLQRARTLQELTTIDENLVATIQQLKTGGRELVHVKIENEMIPLSLYAIELTRENEHVKWISISNLQTEMEEKEMDAWQNLVRVLTHEIMNSVTPIMSLTTSMNDDLNTKVQTQNRQLTEQEMEDFHLSIQTISRRSEGLIQFVQEFRSLTHVPKPKMTHFVVEELIQDIYQLHKQALDKNMIQVEVALQPRVTVFADRMLIEQVLINLVKNAMHALENRTEKKITLAAGTDEKGKSWIAVKDNGTGIDQAALEKIFIPFYTTKKTGSGIGLSLSRQIMRQHQGRLSVRSVLGEGTEFTLHFA